MYKHLYKYWLEDGYIQPLANPHYQDFNGNKVECTSHHKLGRKVHYKWNYPNRMLCANKVGCNTNMLKGKSHSCHVVGETKVGRPVVECANEDCHFTSLCFVTMTGIPVLMVTIIPSRHKMDITVEKGYDASNPWIGLE